MYELHLLTMTYNHYYDLTPNGLLNEVKAVVIKVVLLFLFILLSLQE